MKHVNKFRVNFVQANIYQKLALILIDEEGEDYQKNLRMNTSRMITSCSVMVKV